MVSILTTVNLKYFNKSDDTNQGGIFEGCTWQNAFSISNCFVIASNNDVISRSEGEGGGQIGPKNCGYPYSMPPKQNDD